MNFNRDLLRGNLELMVLAVLAEGRMYGYQIQKQVHEIGQGQIELKAGTLYRLLYRLESTGDIRGVLKEEGGRERRWYELTASGHKRLQKDATAWQTLSHCVARFVKPFVEPSPKSKPQT